VGFAVVVAVWASVVELFDVPSYRAPTPAAVVRALVDERSTLDDHVRATLSVAVLGLGASAVVGVAAATALWRWRVLHQAAYPLLVASQSIPPVVFAPILAVWFGYGTGPRVAVVALVGFFPVAVALTDALAAAPAPLRALVTSMGAGRWRRLLLVDAPAAVPAFFSGLTVAASYAMFGAIVAEWMGAERGLGVFINRSERSFLTPQIWAAVVLVGAASVVLVALVRGLGRLATPWLHADAPDATRARRRGLRSRPEPTPLPWSPS